MKKRMYFLSALLVLAGCTVDRPVTPKAKERAAMTPPTVTRKMPLTGFDPEGEPEIRVMSDGSLMIAFNFMPPSWAEDDEKRFADFDKQLEKALGVPVQWEDREFFLVRAPALDTVEKTRAFLEGYRNK